VVAVAAAGNLVGSPDKAEDFDSLVDAVEEVVVAAAGHDKVVGGVAGDLYMVGFVAAGIARRRSTDFVAEAKTVGWRKQDCRPAGS